MSVTSINDVVEYIKSKFKDILQNDISDYELTMIRNSIELVQREIPNSKVMISDRINDATKAKSDIHYLIMRLKDRRKLISLKYNSDYNKNFTILTRQGRPSKQAIESEIYYLHPDMQDTAYKINDIDQLIDYLNAQLSILDAFVRNLEGRRYDL